MLTSPTRQYSTNEIADRVFKELWALGTSRKGRIIIIQRFLDLAYKRDETAKRYRKHKNLAEAYELKLQEIFQTFKHQCVTEVHKYTQDEIERLELYNQLKYDVLAELQLRSVQLLGLDTRFKLYISAAILGVATVGTIGYILWHKLSGRRQEELKQELHESQTRAIM